MIGKLKELTVNFDQSQNITITVNEDFRETFDKLKDKSLDITIKPVSKKRSMDANSYFWHLCDAISKASSKFYTGGKNGVYREAIQAEGEWDEVVVKVDALQTFMKRWEEQGTGWFAEVIDDYVEDYDDIMGVKADPRKVVHVYYGSSTYDSLAMSKIIDYVVNIANDLGLPTITEREKEKMIQMWGKKKGETNE